MFVSLPGIPAFLFNIPAWSSALAHTTHHRTAFAALASCFQINQELQHLLQIQQTHTMYLNTGLIMIYTHLKLLTQVTLNKLSSVLFVFELTDIIAHSSIIPFLPNVPPGGGKKRDLSADINHTQFTEHIL